MKLTRLVIIQAAIALGVLGLGFVSSQVYVLLGSVLAAALIWRARPDALPAMLILNVSPTDFLQLDPLSDDAQLASFEGNYVMLGGFPLTINLVFALTIGVRILSELMQRPGTFYGKTRYLVFLFWLIAGGITTLICIRGRMEGWMGWSDPMRSVLIIGCYFYGFILAKRWPIEEPFLFKWIVPALSVLGLLAAIGVFHNRLIWVMAPLMPAVGVAAFQMKNWWFRGFAWLGALALGSYCMLGPGFGGHEAETGTESSTFTLQGLYALGLLLALIRVAVPPRGVRLVGNLLSYPAFIVIFTFTIWVVLNQPKYSIGRQAMADRDSYSVIERLQSKIFDDRALVWKSTWDMVSSPLYLLPAAGTPMKLIHPTKGEMLVTFGSHHTFLNQIRLNGWFSGVIIIGIMMLATRNVTRVYSGADVPDLWALSVGMIATCTYGALTGHYVIGPNAGFFVFAHMGVVYSIYLDRDRMQRMLAARDLAEAPVPPPVRANERRFRPAVAAGR